VHTNRAFEQLVERTRSPPSQGEREGGGEGGAYPVHTNRAFEQLVERTRNPPSQGGREGGREGGRT